VVAPWRAIIDQPFFTFDFQLNLFFKFLYCIPAYSRVISLLFNYHQYIGLLFNYHQYIVLLFNYHQYIILLFNHHQYIVLLCDQVTSSMFHSPVLDSIVRQVLVNCVYHTNLSAKKQETLLCRQL
jgi:hypothetical protein